MTATFWLLLALGTIICLQLTRIITLLERIAVNTPESHAMPVAVPHRPDEPRAGRHSFAGVIDNGSYNGMRYDLHGDGMVVSEIQGSPATWRNQAEFEAWVDRQSV